MKWTKKIARPELEADGGKPSIKLRGNVKEVRKLFEKFKKKIIIMFIYLISEATKLNTQQW